MPDLSLGQWIAVAALGWTVAVLAIRSMARADDGNDDPCWRGNCRYPETHYR